MPPSPPRRRARGKNRRWGQAIPTFVGDGPDGTQATLELVEGPRYSNLGRRLIDTFEREGWTYTLDLPAGGDYPPELVEQVLATMVLVPR